MGIIDYFKYIKEKGWTARCKNDLLEEIASNLAAAENAVSDKDKKKRIDDATIYAQRLHELAPGTYDTRHLDQTVLKAGISTKLRAQYIASQALEVLAGFPDAINKDKLEANLLILRARAYADCIPGEKNHFAALATADLARAKSLTSNVDKLIEITEKESRVANYL